MQQKWWLFAAGGVGIVLAVLLFPRPDTGDEVSPADPASAQQALNFKEDAPRRVITRRLGRDLPARKGEAIKGPNPLAREAVERRSAPEALYAGRATGPWTMLRRELMLMEGDEEASALAEELKTLILDLREVRRDPSDADYATLMERQRKYLDLVRAKEEWLSNDTVSVSAERVDTFLDEYVAQAKESKE